MKAWRRTQRAKTGDATVCQNPECGKALTPGQSLTQPKLYCGEPCRTRAARLRRPDRLKRREP